jgi:hypothetical protein
MEFTELKMIWDSQNQEPLYAMNEAALHRIVQRRNQQSERCLSRCFENEITFGVFFGAFTLVCAGMLFFDGPTVLAALPRMKTAASGWDIVALIAAGLLGFYYAAYMHRARKRQQNRVETFERTLRGDLDRAVATTEFQIVLARNIVWWGLVPLWIGCALWVVTLLHLKAAPPAWAYTWAYIMMAALLMVSLAVVVWTRQRAITNRYEPRRRELKSFRAKLADPQH